MNTWIQPSRPDILSPLHGLRMSRGRDKHALGGGEDVLQALAWHTGVPSSGARGHFRTQQRSAQPRCPGAVAPQTERGEQARARLAQLLTRAVAPTRSCPLPGGRTPARSPGGGRRGAESWESRADRLVPGQSLVSHRSPFPSTLCEHSPRR